MLNLKKLNYVKFEIYNKNKLSYTRDVRQEKILYCKPLTLWLSTSKTHSVERLKKECILRI